MNFKGIQFLPAVSVLSLSCFYSVLAFAQGTAQAPQTSVTQIQASEENKQNADLKQAAVSLSDSEAMKLADLIHEVSLQTSEVGQNKANEVAVKAHAQQVEHDHEGVNRALENFEKKTAMSPKESPLSRQYEKKWQKRIDDLKKMEKGSKFDQAYIENEIQFHEEALQLINSSLAQNIENKELKEIVAKTKVAMQTTLQHAQYTQNTFKNEGVRSF